MRANQIFLVLIIFILLFSCKQQPEVTPDPSNEPEPKSNNSQRECPIFNWKTTIEDNVLIINYGFFTTYPQFAAFHLHSGYLRMISSEESGWGTSIIIPPVFWENNQLFQGSEINISDIFIDSCGLVIDFTSQMNQLQLSGRVKFFPPDLDRKEFKAKVNVKVTGSVNLDNRPGEAFKIVTLSSMNIADKNLGGNGIWDSPEAFVEKDQYPIPLSEGWILSPPIVSDFFGLEGGSSQWKENAPRIEIHLEKPFSITGWKTESTDPNDDNIGFWASSDTMTSKWEYQIISKFVE